MKSFTCLLAIVACVWGQYTSDVQNYEDNLPSTICGAGFDCVHGGICVKGVIDVSGGSLITQRIKQSSCQIPNVCCGIPGYVAPPPPQEAQCKPNEDCVSAKICSKDGIIDVTGGSLIDQRSKIPPSTCLNKDFPSEASVCCLKPYVCPTYQKCVHKYECNVNGLIDTSGSLTTYYNKGIPCFDDIVNEGVCCTAPEPVVDKYPVADRCGIRNEKFDENYVPTGYGKEDSAFGEFPWMAIIFRVNPGGNPDQLLFQCGGVLISDKHVLTAGHCVYGLGPHEVGVRFGEWEVNSVKEPLPYLDRYVKNLKVHQDYINTHNNIAVLELQEPVPFHFHINTVCLSKDKIYSGLCLASGWGKDSFDGSYQHILKKLEIPYVEHNLCQDLLRKTELSRYFQLHGSVACAGGDASRDTCTGDGGGPLVCRDPASGQYYLAGLVNAGLGCGRQDVPGLYVNVPYFTQWIDDAILEFSKKEQNPPSYSG